MLDVPKVIHRALLVGATLAAAVLALLRRTAPPAGVLLSPSVLRYVVLALAAGVIVALLTMRRRIPARAPDGDAAAWWRAAQGPAIAAWALAESLMLVGAIFYYLGGDIVPAGVVGLGLLLLVGAAPDRLAGD